MIIRVCHFPHLGTGKTSTILGIIAVLLDQMLSYSDPQCCLGSSALPPRDDAELGMGRRIMLCAPSNAAIDELLSRLVDGVLKAGDVEKRQLKVSAMLSSSCKQHPQVIRP